MATAHGQTDPLRLFQLKPLRSARVSGISESTAASTVRAEERVNFHIGNPLQDGRLSSAFLRIILGIDVGLEKYGDRDLEPLLQHLGWTTSERPILELLVRLIRNSAPYLPRGGYSRQNPPALLHAICAWLENQQEALSYDLGQQSGRREIILASGGVEESLRILFHTLSNYLAVRPARIMLFKTSLLDELRSMDGLFFEDLPESERSAREEIQAALTAESGRPAFLVIGGLLGEETRRGLRALSLSHPLFFVEVNDAPNHLSLAREARLTQRVLRFLTPGVFSPRLAGLSTVFVAGNAELLKAFESVHFQLKGTPSASEVEFLSFLLDHGKAADASEERQQGIARIPSFEGLGLGVPAEERVPAHVSTAERHLGSLVESRARIVERALERLSGRAENLVQRMLRPLAGTALDDSGLLETLEFVGEWTRRVDSREWEDALVRSFLSVFVRHQPQYRLRDCTAVSGSSRTALALLGFHCGLREAVVPDLSWSYEHCFPVIHAVPLTRNFELDGGAVLAAVDARIAADSSWADRGAVVLNNPHNATGQVFDARSVRALLCGLMERNVFVIDDLSYQNVAPVDDLPEIPTLRQVANGLVRTGAVTGEQAERVVTVHSMSKTDCLAGARLSVVEIRREELRERFRRWNARIRPNIAALGLCYLLYRGDLESVRAYWRLRNSLFRERTGALIDAQANLPEDRNPYRIGITPPRGSMYPLLSVERLPPGLSLDWLASGLARQGIGMLPLATFARTESGFEAARKIFRLTLGGTDGADALLSKTRRVLIDLNRIIAEEAANYNRILPAFKPAGSGVVDRGDLQLRWRSIEESITTRCVSSRRFRDFFPGNSGKEWGYFRKEYLPARLEQFRSRLFDRAAAAGEMVRAAQGDEAGSLARILETEFYKDDLARRAEAFRLRLYDRTVHPTQMFSITAEQKFESIIRDLVRGTAPAEGIIPEAAEELTREYLGLNVGITSHDEADEIILDLDALIAGEIHAQLFADAPCPAFISFWGDWDGSNRPSGQGHRLVASVVMENVNRLARIMSLLLRGGGDPGMSPDLAGELQRLPERNRRFARLLEDITLLTHQLERRYRGLLPFKVQPNTLRRIGMLLGLTGDPLKVLWQHNDRLERRMLELRRRRQETLEYYFALNRKLRKQLHALIPEICGRRTETELLLEASLYRDLLKRVIITPRIQQGQVTAKDQFAIDTTVHNLFEINAISAAQGNPGLILALQVSLSTRPEALIALDRKMTARREQMLRSRPDLALPFIWLIPLFEDTDSVRGVPAYLNKIWDHALQSRRAGQDARERFSQIIVEVFIAGSDLSQQVGQAPGAFLYREAKRDLMLWLAEHGMADLVRMKLGSGEPMQRQGGYYTRFAGQPAFSLSPDAERRYRASLPAGARQSIRHAVTPLLGVLSGGDLRTYQSNISEQLRFLPLEELVGLLYHVGKAQTRHRESLIRAAEALSESRLQLGNRHSQEMERLTVGFREQLYGDFLTSLTESYRQILYGRAEDVVGIHAISYFIARSMPQLRDRPTNRRSLGAGAERGQKILAGIAEIIPLARQGSLLRAIAHNQAQTVVLGVNQLTSGLFRALERFSQKTFAEAERTTMIAERILPHLPVYEILRTLQLYQDPAAEYVRRIEPAFPAGNTSFVALREDNDFMRTFLPLVQQELLRRHGLDVGDFFVDGEIVPDLLPTLRPDLAVLLQPDLFNTDADKLLAGSSGRAADEWLREVRIQLGLPEETRALRARIWEILERSVYDRVQSFAELATALHSLSGGQEITSQPVSARGARLSPALEAFFRTARSDDEMRGFLVGAIEYLAAMSEGNVEVPVSIVRAMNEVERIAAIEEHVLPPRKLELLRFYCLRIARLAGENG